MARIAGVDLPREKKIQISLTYIYGIGDYRATEMLQRAKIDAESKCKDLNEQEIGKLREIVENNYQVEGDLKRIENFNLKRLIDIGTYRGRRHRSHLPSRGQRTRTNARTRKGSKKTVANKKRAPSKK